MLNAKSDVLKVWSKILDQWDFTVRWATQVCSWFGRFVRQRKCVWWRYNSMCLWVRTDWERQRKWNRMSLSDNLKAVLDICRDLDGGYAWDSLIWEALKCTSIQPHNGEPPQFVSSIPWLFWKEWRNFSCSLVQGGPELEGLGKPILLSSYSFFRSGIMWQHFLLYYLHELIFGIYWGIQISESFRKIWTFFLLNMINDKNVL